MMPKIIKLKELQPKRRGSIDPSKYPSETFTLYSIPAYDNGEPQLLTGAEIGSAKQLVSNGDVLISKIVPHIRRAWVVSDDYGNRQIASGEWIVFNSEKIVPEFFRHYLLSDVFHQKFMMTVAGVGGSLLRAQPRLVADFDFLLPPIAEQKRIAKLLDTASNVLRLREQTISKLDNLISSLFNDLFGNKSSWPTKRLEEIAKTSSGGTPKRDVADYYGGDIYWVKSGELNCDLITSTEECISEDGLKNSSAKIMPKGTVLLAMYGATVGASSLLGVPASTNQAICCISVDESTLTPEYLLYFLRANKSKIIGMAVGGAQPNINQNIVRSLSIPLPPIEKQYEFVAYASQIKEHIDLQRSSGNRLGSLKLSLQHRSFAVN